ncbi:hypothetical protein [Romboutsia sp. 1001713B170207_170306_H8]|uniref:hypothetical protein n=1 Tax=Romboutsia sp. 1001713B170207_170306_H8 TaxID=2787112 RepID=UPI001898E137|nr:hypothetical protein [Romboutsia sp. 1001713B170207_170306_H8]
MLGEDSLALGFVCGDYEGAVNKVLVKQDKAYIVSKYTIDIDKLLQMQRIDYKSNYKSIEILNKCRNERYKENQHKGMSSGYIDFAWKLIDKGLGYTTCFLADEFKNKYNLELYSLLDSRGKNITRNTWFIYSKTKKFNKIEEEFIKFIQDKMISI